VRWLFLLAFLLLPAQQGQPRRLAGPAAAAEDDPLLPLARQVFDLANLQRRLHHLPPLEWSSALADQARLQSANMMERGFFSHVDPVRGELSKRLNSAGVRWSRCGENIYRESGMEDPAGQAVEGWMKSPAHRSSLLDPLFTAAGVGIAISPSTEYFITQDFIQPPK